MTFNELLNNQIFNDIDSNGGTTNIIKQVDYIFKQNPHYINYELDLKMDYDKQIVKYTICFFDENYVLLDEFFVESPIKTNLSNKTKQQIIKGDLMGLKCFTDKEVKIKLISPDDEVKIELIVD